MVKLHLYYVNTTKTPTDSKMSHTLLLNADVQPVSMLPLSTLTWQDTMKLVYLNKVTVLEYYDDWKINTSNDSFKVPSVIMVNEYITRKSRIALTKNNLFLRDAYKCQYCGKNFPHMNLTYDHVIPRSKGGGTNWENIVAACKPCNNKKGSKLIDPINAPFIPTYWNLIKQCSRVPVIINHSSWERFIDPKMNVRLSSDFDMSMRRT